MCDNFIFLPNVIADDAALRGADNRFRFFEKDIENMAKGTRELLFRTMLYHRYGIFL